jgi:hypothetical protein
VRNSYGFQTETSGTVTVRVNVVSQSQYLWESNYRTLDLRQSVELLTKPRLVTAVQSTVHGIYRSDLDALHRAKIRLKALRSFDRLENKENEETSQVNESPTTAVAVADAPVSPETILSAVSSATTPVVLQ